MRSKYHRLMYRFDRWRMNRRLSSKFWDSEEVRQHEERVARAFDWSTL